MNGWQLGCRSPPGARHYTCLLHVSTTVYGSFLQIPHPQSLTNSCETYCSQLLSTNSVVDRLWPLRLAEMGKWARYSKWFQCNWLKEPQFEKWLVEVKHDEKKAYCKVCKAELRAHKSDLKKHSETEKHIQNMKKIPSAKQMSVKSLSES